MKCYICFVSFTFGTFLYYFAVHCFEALVTVVNNLNSKLKRVISGINVSGYKPNNRNAQNWKIVWWFHEKELHEKNSLMQVWLIFQAKSIPVCHQYFHLWHSTWAYANTKNNYEGTLKNYRSDSRSRVWDGFLRCIFSL